MAFSALIEPLHGIRTEQIFGVLGLFHGVFQSFRFFLSEWLRFSADERQVRGMLPTLRYASLQVA
jgi:hypothetical protein